MSITDELREFASTKVPYSYGNQISRIANRIDTEHERGMNERADRYSELRAKMNNCYIELPKDADGEYIHIGDVMENIVCPSVHREVTGVGVECFYGFDEGNGRYSQFGANCYRHHHKPTVEDVLRDMHAKLDEVTALYVGEAIDSDERDSDETHIFAEYAAKLRLAGSDVE